jgi:ABC-2 type transport system ATP-binding protein
MIAVREVTKRYGPTMAVEGVSFTAPSGTVTGFLGPNGAGKTTTLRTVGAVLDTMGFHPGRTGRNHLRGTARAAGLPRQRVDEVLEFVGLAAADRRVGGVLPRHAPAPGPGRRATAPSS